MRTREEIVSDVVRQIKGLNVPEIQSQVFYQMILETLLDIRDLLRTEGGNEGGGL